jgi:hypothetical protein
MITGAHRLRRAWLCAVAVMVGGGCAARQPSRSFLDLQERLHSGNTVYVTDTTGTETKGKVVEVSGSALVLDVKGVHRRMDQSSVRHVQRHGDPLWNGLLIGVAVGASAMLVADPRYEPCTNSPKTLCANSQMGQRVLAVGIMGAGGAGIDALIGGRRYVYLAPGQRLQGAQSPFVPPPIGRSADLVFVTPDLNKRTATECGIARSIAQLVGCVQARSEAERSKGDTR